MRCANSPCSPGVGPETCGEMGAVNVPPWLAVSDGHRAATVPLAFKAFFSTEGETGAMLLSPP